jgi:hypothetical protein
MRIASLMIKDHEQRLYGNKRIEISRRKKKKSAVWKSPPQKVRQRGFKSSRSSSPAAHIRFLKLAVGSGLTLDMILRDLERVPDSRDIHVKHRPDGPHHLWS